MTETEAIFIDTGDFLLLSAASKMYDSVDLTGILGDTVSWLRSTVRLQVLGAVSSLVTCTLVGMCS